MTGNCHVRFLGEGLAVMPVSYPTSATESDILKFVIPLIANTKGDGKEGDRFLDKAETLLYCALIAYITLKGRRRIGT